ncbi:MAG TPA: flavin reductase family protein [Candidatus Acidoferrum sp.]|nr:flavin reductase family protein [Candidatus Acidoferrum sp.]
MEKVTLETNALLVPAPVLLLSCVGEAGAPNIMGVSWASVACATPPMVSVAIRAERLSYSLIRETGEFVLNIPSASLLRAVDFCGTVSGQNLDKFAKAGLTPMPGLKVRAPLVQECPVNLECVVRQSLVLGSHVLFLAEVVALRADQEVVEDGAIIAGRVAPLAYDPFGGDYWNLKEVVGHHGFSEGTMPERATPKRMEQKRV